MKPSSIQSNAISNSTSSHRKYIRILRVAVWNILFVISGLLLVALAGEIYLRLANPFIETSSPFLHFVDGVGPIRKPNSELRFADWNNDNFVVSRANSLGFLDREPVSPERAAAACHIAFIGDSFVESKEVPIADKFHVRLEEIAARELPRLDITTQAYGISNTGQINQLPFYDEYALHMNPKLLILVFYLNDFSDNSIATQALKYGADPDRMPFMSAQRDERGAMKLRPPDSEFQQFMLPSRPQRWYGRAWKRIIQVSYFAKWLHTKGIQTWVDHHPRPTAAWADMIAERPCCSWLPDVWQHGERGFIERHQFAENNLPPIYEDMLEYTAFGIEQFKRRTDRDGVRLAILSTTADMGMRGDPQFDRLNAIAEAHGIPVISDYAYIVKQGHDEWNLRWHANIHWNATGHQRVAEAILEWLKSNQDVCD